MAEEKPFDPTAARLARAKREGDLPSSQAVIVIGASACGALALFGVLTTLGAACRAALVAAASGAVSGGALAVIALAALSIPVASAAGSLGATLLQYGTLGFRFPAFRLEKLNPAQGLKRMVSRDAAIAGAKALVVASAVGCALVPVAAGAFAAAGGASPAELAGLVLGALRGEFATALGAAACFAAADVVLERAKWKRRLRMSFDELKREHKASEGDPLLRGRRRQAHRALVRGSIGKLKEAAFVVCNPTHVAVALAYRPPAIAVPQVLVRGIDAGALAVKRRARELGVPLVENAPLARALLAATEAGDFIPADAYGAVAAIVAALVRDGAIA